MKQYPLHLPHASQKCIWPSDSSFSSLPDYSRPSQNRGPTSILNSPATPFLQAESPQSAPGLFTRPSDGGGSNLQPTNYSFTRSCRTSRYVPLKQLRSQFDDFCTLFEGVGPPSKNMVGKSLNSSWRDSNGVYQPYVDNYGGKIDQVAYAFVVLVSWRREWCVRGFEDLIAGCEGTGKYRGHSAGGWVWYEGLNVTLKTCDGKCPRKEA